MPIEGKESMRWLDNLRQSTGLLGDPARCVHICDREGDIWELFCLARELDTHFLVRRCSDRLAGDGSRTVASIMAEEKVQGLHRVADRDDKGKLGSTQVEISYRRMTTRPPIAKQRRYPALMLTVLHAREPEEPVGRPSIDWELITDLPVDGHAAAVEKLQWYAMRWKIEVFHKILKSGGRAEQARLRTAERLVRLLAVFCILSWRMFSLTMLNRVKPDLEPTLMLTELETGILDRLIPDPTANPSPASTPSLPRGVRSASTMRAMWSEILSTMIRRHAPAAPVLASDQPGELIPSWRNRAARTVSWNNSRPGLQGSCLSLTSSWHAHPVAPMRCADVNRYPTAASASDRGGSQPPSPKQLSDRHQCDRGSEPGLSFAEISRCANQRREVRSVGSGALEGDIEKPLILRGCEPFALVTTALNQVEKYLTAVEIGILPCQCAVDAEIGRPARIA